MSTIYYVDKNGVYKDGWDGVEPPEGLLPVPSAPDDARQIWDFKNKVWLPVPAVVPVSVTARQFKLQLLAAGLIDQVEAWISAQDRATQIAYEYSGSFVREEPMMQAGFTSMGFEPDQIDAFFVAASRL